MPRTSFTTEEWSEFCDGFDNPDDAFYVADRIWTRERMDDLKAIREFCDDRVSKGLLEAAEALAPTSSAYFHEIEERLLRYLYDNSEGYRDHLEYKSIVAAERRFSM
jgi:hypothetical protein